MQTQLTAISFQQPYVPNQKDKGQKQETISYLEMSESELYRVAHSYQAEKNEAVKNRPKGKRFTKEQVFSILKSKQTCMVLAALYEVSLSAIHGVKSGKSYKEWFREWREILH